MYYEKYKKKKGDILLRGFFMISAVIIILLIFNGILTHLIKDMVISVSRNEASKALNDAVQEVIENGRYDYSKFVEIINDESGSVQSVSARSDMVNSFKSEIGSAVLERLKEFETANFSVPLGTLLDIGMLYDKGPKIDIRLKTYGGMTTGLKSTFVSAGINQTKHSMICTVKTNIAIITPSFTTFAEVEGEFLIAETVIIGKIPDSYTNVNGDDSGIIGQIFDYAEVG